MQNWSKLVFVLILCNSLIVTGEKKNPTLSFLRYIVVPARQVPFPGSPEGSPGNGTWLAGTTLSRRMTAWDSLNPSCYFIYYVASIPAVPLYILLPLSQLLLYIFCCLYPSWYFIYSVASIPAGTLYILLPLSQLLLYIFCCLLLQVLPHCHLPSVRVLKAWYISAYHRRASRRGVLIN